MPVDHDSLAKAAAATHAAIDAAVAEITQRESELQAITERHEKERWDLDAGKAALERERYVPIYV